jgi:hypothetical protein
MELIRAIDSVSFLIDLSFAIDSKSEVAQGRSDTILFDLLTEE